MPEVLIPFDSLPEIILQCAVSFLEGHGSPLPICIPLPVGVSRA